MCIVSSSAPWRSNGWGRTRVSFFAICVASGRGFFTSPSSPRCCAGGFILIFRLSSVIPWRRDTSDIFPRHDPAVSGSGPIPLSSLGAMRHALAFVVSLAACAGPSAVRPATDRVRPPLSFADETRAMLDQLVAVDTSHGHETDALRPIAERLGALPMTLVESAPGRGNLIARYKGTGAKRPLLLIAHVDVVPVEGQPWTVPAFQLTEKDGFLYGRGVNDDKGMAAAIIAIALEMAKTKPVLSRDVIFALTAGEETGGGPGARWLAANRKDLIDAELALNEGGGPKLDDRAERLVQVDIGAAEKTFQDYKVVVKGKGGHSSIPPTDADPVLSLARALVKIAEFRFPARVIAAARDELGAEAKRESPPLSEAEARTAKT